MTSDSKWIWFDMDGTLSDLYAVPGWKEKVRAFDPAPYREAKPLLHFAAFARQVNALKRKGYHVGVISWSSRVSTPEYHEAVAAAKHAWLRRHLPSVSWDSVLVVPFGTPKWQVCAPGMLFDDDEQNLIAWREHAMGEAYGAEDITRILSAMNRRGGTIHEEV